MVVKKVLDYFADLRPGSVRRLVKLYPAAALGALFGSAWYWALLGAQVQSGNADQLANTYLFDHAQTFHQATLPDQHTFLFKWPLFLLIRAFGSTNTAFTLVTIGVTLATIAAFAYMLYRIDRRPLVFGTLCLALAAVLVAIPAQPYPGGILPVNMAMITTRNLEYIVFMASLVLAVRAARWRDWRLVVAVACLTLLIASDKLFMTIALGGGALALLFYAAVRNWKLCKAALRWLVIGAASTALAWGLLLAINKIGLTHIAAGAVTGPYGIVHTSKELLLGGVYLALAMLTNFGANPVGDVRLFSQFPHQLATSFTDVTGVVYIVNGLCLLLAVVAAVCMLALAGKRPRRDAKHVKLSQAQRKRDTDIVASATGTATGVATLLIWSSVVAAAAFVASNHYYPVDARYVTIAFFALFVALAAYARSREIRGRLLAGAGLVLFASVLLGLGLATRTYRAEQLALRDTKNRNRMVVQAIRQHPVDVLVGDYWRVLPARLASKNALNVLPLESCTQPRDVLSSKAWQPDLSTHSFAYLLTLDQSLTGYQPCNLQQIVQAYGAPNSSVVLTGTTSNPHEILLFYDKGAHKSAPKSQTAGTVGPVDLASLASLARTPCSGSTIMNFVAHQDDDLLFMNPDLQNDIRAGDCVRTVYVTSGDAGTDKYYWLGREQGSEAAYNHMLNSAAIWVQRSVKLPGGQIVAVSNPQGDSRVSLIFMRLPDGNVMGQGFESTHHESLARLEKGAIPVVHSSDHQSVYTSADITQALAGLMETYQPTEINTQANVVDHTHPDHSDHMAVGRYTQHAHDAYSQARLATGDAEPSIKFYIGYPVRNLPANVSGADLQEKERIFFAYAGFDKGVCDSEAQCASGSVYQTYLTREYQSDH